MGYAMTSGSAGVSGSAATSGLAGYATQSGTAAYSVDAGTSGFATLSGTATFAGVAATSGSAAVSGSAQMANVAIAADSGTATVIAAQAGSTKIDIGDSITANPNGAGQTSWAQLLNTLSYFNGRVTDYNTAVGGSVIGNGPTPASGSPQSVTATWSGQTTSLVITSGSPSTTGGYPIAGPMSVTGTNIPYGTTGTLAGSGTLIILSQATTGASGGNVTVKLGGNNMTDRFASQVYPHRPTANGGDGGLVSYALIMGGANDLSVGVSGTTIINELIALTGSCEACGITPYVSTILPDIGNDHWSSSQEAQRQLVNQFIREHGIPGAQVVDSCQALSGNPALFDSNGVHPIGPANAMLANYWNSALMAGCDIYPADVGYVENNTEFSQWVTLDQGIQYSGSTGQTWFSINQPNMAAGTASDMIFGGAQTQYDCGFLVYGMDGLVADPANYVELGVWNARAGLCVYGTGEASVGVSPSAWKSLGYNGTEFLSESINAESTFEGLNYSTGGQVLAQFLMPNLAQGQNDYGPFVGVAGNLRNSGGLFFHYASPYSLSNAIGLTFNGLPPAFWMFGGGDVVLGTSGNDNGYGLEVNGTERVDSSSTVGGSSTVTTTGSSAMTGPLNTSTPALWEKVLVNGTTAWRPLYQ